MIRKLLKWAAPELFARAIPYCVIEGGKIVHQGEFVGLRGWRDIPWQITLPTVESIRVWAVAGGEIAPPHPAEFKTYYRHRGSLDPVLYFRMEEAP